MLILEYEMVGILQINQQRLELVHLCTLVLQHHLQSCSSLIMVKVARKHPIGYHLGSVLVIDSAPHLQLLLKHTGLRCAIALIYWIGMINVPMDTNWDTAQAGGQVYIDMTCIC